MVPDNFSRIAKKKVMMQLDQGYVITDSSPEEVVLKRVDPMYGNTRENYQRVDPWGTFTICRQSEDLVVNIEKSKAHYEKRLKGCHYPEDAHSALSDHMKEVHSLTAEFRKAVIDE